MVDEKTIYTAMKEVCNFFIRSNDVARYEGHVVIKDKQLNFNVPSPYIIIRGSHKNDGLYLMDDARHIHGTVFYEGDVHPVDEEFEGRVWFSYPTQDFLALCDQIATFQAKMPQTDVVSESFGSSSRSFAQGQNGQLTWKEQYGNSLRPYRNHMFEEVW